MSLAPEQLASCLSDVSDVKPDIHRTPSETCNQYASARRNKKVRKGGSLAHLETGKETRSLAESHHVPEWPELFQFWRLDPRALSASWMSQALQVSHSHSIRGLWAFILSLNQGYSFPTSPPKNILLLSESTQSRRTYPTQSIAS